MGDPLSSTEVVIRQWLRVAGLAFLLLTEQQALAEQGTAAEPGPVIWGIDGGLAFQFSTDLEDTDTSFSVTHGFIQPSVTYAWNRRNTVSLSLGFGESDYDFSPGADLEGLAPWGSIQDYHLSVRLRFSPSERTDVFIRPTVRSYVEEGVDLDEGRTEGLISGISWVVSDSLLIGPGIGWYSKLGGGSFVFPILIIDWKITERLSLTTGRGLAASLGPGLALVYRLSDRWRMGLTGRMERARFALDTDDISAASGVEYGKDQSASLLFNVQYSPWRGTSVSGFVGMDLDGRLSLRDARGDTIARTDYEPPALIGLAFRSRF